MKEIKFRAWNRDQKRWATHDELLGVVPVSANILAPSAITIGKEDSDWIFVQFTGLKDRNGREIYEDDIIHGPVVTDTPYTAECPSLQYFHWYQHLEDAIEEGKQIEVIGNRFENPKLLKAV